MQEQRVAPYLASWKFATGIEICDHSFLKLLIAWFLMFKGQTVAARFEPLVFLQFGGYINPLIGSQKGLWLLASILIPVANASLASVNLKA